MKHISVSYYMYISLKKLPTQTFVFVLTCRLVQYIAMSSYFSLKSVFQILPLTDRVDCKIQYWFKVSKKAKSGIDTNKYSSATGHIMASILWCFS